MPILAHAFSLSIALAAAKSSLTLSGPSRLPSFLLTEYAQPRAELDEAVATSPAERAAVARVAAFAADIAREQEQSHRCSASTLSAVNRQLFERLAVRYDPPATRVPNQPVFETVATGTATCTGLSLVLLAALRSLGVPARMAGTRAWGEGEGNHNCERPSRWRVMM